MRLLFALVVLATPALAQPSAPLPFPEAAPVPALSEEASVSLLTMLPGREVYSLFGHTALRLRDPLLGLDRTYNYGTFDFNQPFFVLRFLRGHLDYQLAVASFERTVAEYRYQDRPILEQHLALTPDERQALFLFLESNYLPAQRVYRYDFLFDNCSTRPWEALAWATGGRLSLGGYAPPEGTFRDLLQPYIAADPGLRLGIALGLGSTVDRRPTPREGLFLPLELFDAAERAHVDGRPLVAATDTVFWVEGAGLPAPALPWPTVLAWLVLSLGAFLSYVRRGTRALDATLLAVTGLGGLILLLLWVATEHHVTHGNLDLLWLWPTHLVAAVLVARGARLPALRIYLAFAGGVALIPAVLTVVGVAPLHPAVAPLALLLALRGAEHAFRPTHAPAEPRHASR